MDCVTDLLFVLVKPGTVKVTVSSVESVSGGLVRLTLGTLIGEGAKSNS